MKVVDTSRFILLSQGEPTVVTVLASASFEDGRRSKACPLADLTGGRTEITHTEPISDYWRNDDS